MPTYNEMNVTRPDLITSNITRALTSAFACNNMQEKVQQVQHQALPSPDPQATHFIEQSWLVQAHLERWKRVRERKRRAGCKQRDLAAKMARGGDRRVMSKLHISFTVPSPCAANGRSRVPCYRSCPDPLSQPLLILNAVLGSCNTLMSPSSHKSPQLAFVVSGSKRR